MRTTLAVLALLGCGGSATTPSGSPFTYKAVRVASASRHAIHIAAGDTHTCAIMDDGAVACWGDNYNHQFGDGTSDSSLRPTVIAALRGSTQIAAGGTNTCVWQDSRMHCFGTAEYYPAKHDVMVQTGVLTAPAGFANVTSVSLASGHRCMRTTDGTAQCFGENRDGQLGPGVGSLVVHPRAIDGIAGVAEVASSYSHSCARTAAGDVWCWGANRSGDVGDGTTVAHPTPVHVTLGGSASQIATGGDKTCALMTDGTVTCWGMDRAIGRGDCTGQPQLTPSVVPNLRDVAQLVLGWSHACARLTDGSVKCWGSDQHGRLGVGGKTDGAQKCTYSCMFGCTPEHDLHEEYLFHPAPVTVDGLTDIIELAVGDSHTCALSREGRVWCWGENGAGQLGDGTTANRNVPTEPAW